MEVATIGHLGPKGKEEQTNPKNLSKKSRQQEQGHDSTLQREASSSCAIRSENCSGHRSPPEQISRGIKALRPSTFIVLEQFWISMFRNLILIPSRVNQEDHLESSLIIFGKNKKRNNT